LALISLLSDCKSILHQTIINMRKKILHKTYTYIFFKEYVMEVFAVLHISYADLNTNSLYCNICSKTFYYRNNL